MAGKLYDTVLDNGLSLIDTAATAITLCSAEPTVLSLATVGAANVVGYKTFSAGSAFTAPAAGSPTGRKVESVNITDGTLVTTGTASWWAVVASTTALYAHNTLASAQGVTAGGTYSLGLFAITIPSA